MSEEVFGYIERLCRFSAGVKGATVLNIALGQSEARIEGECTVYENRHQTAKSSR